MILLAALLLAVSPCAGPDDVRLQGAPAAQGRSAFQDAAPQISARRDFDGPRRGAASAPVRAGCADDRSGSRISSRADDAVRLNPAFFHDAGAGGVGREPVIYPVSRGFIVIAPRQAPPSAAREAARRGLGRP